MKTKSFYFTILLMSLMCFFSCKKDKPTELTLSDVDGNVYKTIKIGDQIWMAENLKTTKLNDGTPIALVNDMATWTDANITDPMTCYYNNEATNFDKYGLLYNWHAVNTEKLAPKGWHVATKHDWEALISYLIAKGYNYDENNKVDNQIAKSLPATTDWIVDNTPGDPGTNPEKNNKSGFNAKPGGYRSPNGTFKDIGLFSAFWDATLEAEFGRPKTFYIRSDSPDLKEDAAPGNYGLYVRCVKD